MPKTASKRAQAGKVARVQRAHTEPAVVRDDAAARHRAQSKGHPGFTRRSQNFFQRFPVAIGLVAIAVIAVAVLAAQGAKFGPFAPPPPKVASCNLKTHVCNEAPPMTINVNKTYTATIKTDKGDIVIALDAKHAPIAVNNFVFLADQHYYDGTYFWRVETPGQPSPIAPNQGASPLSLVQGGAVMKDGSDPTQPGYTIKDDKNFGNYKPGTVAMANKGPNTGGAQFFIDIGDETQFFQPSYVDFGTVTQGMDVVQKITPDTVIQSITINVK